MSKELPLSEENLGGSCAGSTPADEKFDRIVGVIQDICFAESFQVAKNEFMDKHLDVFDDVEENKLEYTPIFKDWCTLIEDHLESGLKEKIAGFDMKEFLKSLASRHDQIDAGLLDMLLSLGDFQFFKEEMLSHKAGGAVAFDGAMTISGMSE
eukprot:m.72621 g.72621  ORF g.72621 m.72621 type:complete len:153 (+) comp16113_c0_seq1:256-714(+)